MRPFTFVFEDPRWVPKVLFGGLFVLASFLIVGLFFIYGYLARLARNVIEGVAHPLPEWDDLAEFFSEGLRLFFIGLLYGLPIVVLALVLVVPAAVLSSHGDTDALRDIGGGLSSCLGCILFPIALAIGVWLPAALLMAIVSRRFSAGFEFARIGRFIMANLPNYLIAFIIALIARSVASLAGLATLCTLLVFTVFWGMVVGSHAFAQVYRISSVK